MCLGGFLGPLFVAGHSRTDGYELPMLNLEVEECTVPYAKPGVPYTIPAGQKGAIMYQVLQQVKKGYMKEVFFEHGMWVSPGFGKSTDRDWPAHP